MNAARPKTTAAFPTGTAAFSFCQAAFRGEFLSSDSHLVRKSNTFAELALFLRADFLPDCG